MSASECQVLGYLRGNQLQNFQFEYPKIKLSGFVWVPTVSDRTRFAVQISKDEAPTPLLTVGLFISAHLLCLSCNFENSLCHSNSTELQAKDIARSSEQ